AAGTVLDRATGQQVPTLPAAPVVDLQLNTTLNELTAAVQGRGVFTLSTQTSGPAVVSSTPATPQGPPLTTISVSFNEAPDQRTLTLTSNVQARFNVTLGLANSLEGRMNRVSDLFKTYLKRGASPAEQTAYAGVLTQPNGDAR